MKYNIKTIPCILIISIFIIFSAFKSDCPNVLWGTKTTYQTAQIVYTNPPQGYLPVFINYVGRHGARHLTNITADSIMFEVLKAAESENALTTAGMKLKRMDSLLLLIEKGNVSFISERGKEEQEGIGERMAKNFYTIFADKNGKINVFTTKKERTKQSAKAFIKGLNPDKQQLTFNYSDNDELAFYDISPEYKIFKKNGNWKAAFESLENSPEAKKLDEEIPKLFFTSTYITKLQSNTIQFKTETHSIKYNIKSFIDGLYDACSIVASLDKEIEKAGYKPNELDFASLLSCSELAELNYLNSAEDFLLKGPGIDANGIQVRIAAPLLLSFISTTNDYITSQTSIADLRFAHAETIAPFAALMDIEGSCEPVTPENIATYNKVWKCENTMPLSANIQMILYKNNTTGDYLVKFLMNENEVNIHGLINSGTAFYYKWNEVKDFYNKKLQSLFLHPGDDIHEYLMNLK